MMTDEDIVLGGTAEGEELSERYDEEHNIYKHSTAKEVRDFVGRDVWDSYYKFAFVRNPWDKMVSTYFWFHKSQWTGSGGKGDKIRKMSFEDYVLSPHMDELSCTDFLFDDGELLVDDCYDISQLATGLGYICGRLGLSLPELSKDNATGHRHYSTYYSNDKVKETVRQRFKDDINNFGFSFEEESIQAGDERLEDEVEFLRDLAISLEDTDLEQARRIMAIAQRGRPGGPFINLKLLEYDKRLQEAAQSVDEQ